MFFDDLNEEAIDDINIKIEWLVKISNVIELTDEQEDIIEDLISDILKTKKKTNVSKEYEYVYRLFIDGCTFDFVVYALKTELGVVI